MVYKWSGGCLAAYHVKTTGTIDRVDLLNRSCFGTLFTPFQNGVPYCDATASINNSLSGSTFIHFNPLFKINNTKKPLSEISLHFEHNVKVHIFPTL